MFCFRYCLCELTAVHGLQSKGKKNIGKWCRLSTYKLPLEKSKVEFRKKFKLLAMYASCIPIKDQLWLSPWTWLDLAGRFVHVTASLPLNLDKSNWRFINPVLFLSAVMSSWLWHAKCHFKRKSYFNNSVDFQTSVLPQSSEFNLLFRDPNHSAA